MYNQDCHYGFCRKHNEGYDEIDSVDELVVECHHKSNTEFYCKFKHFSGGEIPDEECPFFMRNMRDVVK